MNWMPIDDLCPLVRLVCNTLRSFDPIDNLLRDNLLCVQFATGGHQSDIHHDQ